MRAIGKILPIFMSIVLVVGLMPLPAFATDDSDDDCPWSYLESDHDYVNSFDFTWPSYEDSSAEFGLAVTFDERTCVEDGYDFIDLYDGNDNLVGSYTGAELAGEIISIPGSTSFKIRLRTDISIQGWGFKVVDVSPLEESVEDGDSDEPDDPDEGDGLGDEGDEDDPEDEGGDEDDPSDYEAVSSISFNPAKPYQLVEGVGVSEVVDDDGNVRYDYDLPDFADGDALVVTDSEGDEAEYVYGYYEIGDEEDEDFEADYWFVSGDGDLLDRDEFDRAWKDEVNEWVAGTTYQMVVSYCGCACEVDVELIENPVAAIVFEPHAPYRFLKEGEGEYGYWFEPDDLDEFDESGEVQELWFYYCLPWVEEGDKLIVTDGGGKKTTYTAEWPDDGGDLVLVAPTGATIDSSEVEFLSDQEDVGGWDPGIHQVTVAYMNRTCTVDVEVMEAKSIKNATISFAKGKKSYAYTGDNIEPAVIVKLGGETLVEDVDYEVCYKNNVNVDSSGKKPPTVTVTGMGVFKDGKSATFEITPLSIKGKKLVLSKDVFIYNKKVQKPTVKTVGGKKLKAGTDYTVACFDKNSKKVDSKNIGSYTVQVTGKGNYADASAKAIYKILNPNPVKVAAKKPTVSLAKVKKAKQTVAAKNAFSVTGNKGGKVVYKKASGDKMLAVASNGNVTVAKGAKKGAHAVKVTAAFAAKGTYAAATKTVTLNVTVK